MSMPSSGRSRLKVRGGWESVSLESISLGAGKRRPSRRSQYENLLKVAAPLLLSPILFFPCWAQLCPKDTCFQGPAFQTWGSGCLDALTVCQCALASDSRRTEGASELLDLAADVSGLSWNIVCICRPVWSLQCARFTSQLMPLGRTST